MHAIQTIPGRTTPAFSVLTRESLATDGGATLMLRAELSARLQSKAEREASLAAFMATRPADAPRKNPLRILFRR